MIGLPSCIAVVGVWKRLREMPLPCSRMILLCASRQQTLHGSDLHMTAEDGLGFHPTNACLALTAISLKMRNPIKVCWQCRYADTPRAHAADQCLRACHCETL